MITIYPKEYFLIQIIFAQKVCKIKNISFKEAIQDYTNIAQDLLNISEYPPNKEKGWKELLAIKHSNIPNNITTKWYEYYKTLPHSEWKPKDLKTLKYGMFSYTLYPDNTTISLHAGNVRRGEEYSSFSPKYHDENKKDLYRLIKEVSKQNTEVEKVRCSSWINNIDSFVELFPTEYRESLRIKDSNNFLGIWQQFLNKDGEIKEDLMEDFLKKVNIPKSLEQLKDAFPCKVLIGEVDIQCFKK